MSTFKETKRSIVFNSVKDFLDSVGVLFDYAFVMDENRVHKFRFVSHRVNTEDPWSNQTIHFTIQHHTIARDDDRKRYYLTPLSTSTPAEVEDESKYLLDFYDYINFRVLEGSLSSRQPLDKKPLSTVQELTLSAPYQFKPEKLESFVARPGFVTIKVGNGWTLDATQPNTYLYGAFLEFNNWKKAPPSTVSNKRKRSPEAQEEALPELQKTKEDVVEGKIQD